MLFLRLARGGIVEVFEAAIAEREDEFLLVKAADGRTICRFSRLDVLAFSTRRDLIEGRESELPPSP
jgi:hypothetical protein